MQHITKSFKPVPRINYARFKFTIILLALLSLGYYAKADDTSCHNAIEMQQATIDYQFKGKPIQDLRDELIQVGAMVIRTLELIEDYADTKITAKEADFKVGDRVKVLGYGSIASIVSIKVATARIRFREEFLPSILVPLTDLTLITE